MLDQVKEICIAYEWIFVGAQTFWANLFKVDFNWKKQIWVKQKPLLSLDCLIWYQTKTRDMRIKAGFFNVIIQDIAVYMGQMNKSTIHEQL